VAHAAIRGARDAGHRFRSGEDAPLPLTMAQKNTTALRPDRFTPSRALIPTQPRSDTMAQTKNQAAPNKPVKTFRLRGISASVFLNETYQEGQPMRFYKVSLQRTFRQNGEFKHNSSFGRDEIPVAVHVLQQAWAYILEIENASSVEEA
jgi:hypothetical protein